MMFLVLIYNKRVFIMSNRFYARLDSSVFSRLNFLTDQLYFPPVVCTETVY